MKDNEKFMEWMFKFGLPVMAIISVGVLLIYLLIPHTPPWKVALQGVCTGVLFCTSLWARSYLTLKEMLNALIAERDIFTAKYLALRIDLYQEQLEKTFHHNQSSLT